MTETAMKDGGYKGGARQILRGRTLQIIAVLFNILIAIAVAYYFYSISLRKKELSCVFLSQSSLQIEESFRDKLQIKYADTLVTNVHRIDLQLENSGNISLTPADFVEDMLRLKFVGTARLLDTPLVVLKSPSSIQLKTLMMPNETIDCTFDLLNPGDLFQIGVYYTGTLDSLSGVRIKDGRFKIIQIRTAKGNRNPYYIAMSHTLTRVVDWLIFIVALAALALSGAGMFAFSQEEMNPYGVLQNSTRLKRQLPKTFLLLQKLNDAPFYFGYGRDSWLTDSKYRNGVGYLANDNFIADEALMLVEASIDELMVSNYSANAFVNALRDFHTTLANSNRVYHASVREALQGPQGTELLREIEGTLGANYRRVLAANRFFSLDRILTVQKISTLLLLLVAIFGSLSLATMVLMTRIL